MTLDDALRILRAEVRQWKVPVVGWYSPGAGEIAPGVRAESRTRSPYAVLISCILSLRTKDRTTHAAAERLFAAASTPRDMLTLTPRKIERLIYPVGFYRTKAKNILRISRILLERWGGRVPDTIEALLELPGVGRKTANLVVTLGYDKYGICVDTHVHRISNRWGYVQTRSPNETEMALRKKLPRRHWKTFNDLLVTYGQNLCVPISPWCSKCRISSFCRRVGVKTHR
ncbi:MAG: endonuclease III [Nitrospirae bacterium]|nr:endonuclease III [Nitrospirota bacterium]